MKALSLLLLAGLCAVAVSSRAATNLPVVCSTAGAEGQPASACATSAQSFTPATSSSLVRACNTVSCTYAERVWRKMSAVTSTQFVEVCGADKAAGSPLTDCQGTTGTTWGAMALVPPAQVAQSVEALPQFPGTFTVTPSTGAAPLAVTIAWDVSTFTAGTCTASGSWTGSKSLKGSQTVTNLTADASYVLTCARPTLGSALLDWTPPTQNTDGSSLTNLAGYRISYGASATSLTQSVQVAVPAATSYTVTNLNAGTWYFAAKAYTTANAESALSNIVSKTVATTSEQYTATRLVTVTPNVPQPPVLRVSDARVYNATADYSLLAFRPSLLYGSAPLGTPCDESRPIRDGYYPVPLESVRWASTGRTKYPVARCVVQ
jgi:hypothetical protein